MVRGVALLLTVVTGFTGLVYEVAWQKYLAALLGSHAEATAAVLAIFLGGLSTGYALLGRATRRVVERARARGRRPRLLYLYALVESGIGVYALLFPYLYSGALAVSTLGPTGAGAAFAFDVGLSALLIGPPAVLMGGTIPILTLALAGDLAHSTRVHAWIYAANTLGAFGGALVGGFLLVPVLGLDRVVWAMGCANLLAGAIFAQLDRSTAAPDLAGPAAAGPAPRFAAWAAVALLAGFAMMALQTTLNRVGALALGSSQFTFAMVVAVFVLCIALGSLAVSALPRIPAALVAGSQWLLVLLLFPLHRLLGDAPYWMHVARISFRSDGVAFQGFQAATFLLWLAVLALPIGLAGALLPLLFHALRRELSDLGSMAGRLYAWNTVGSLFGALFGGYLLLFWLDLDGVYRTSMLALATGAALLCGLVLRGAPRLLGALLLVPAVGAIAWLPAWEPGRLSAGLFRARQPLPHSFEGPDAFFAERSRGEVIFYDDDPTSSVSVLEGEGGPMSRTILVNGKSDGNLEGDYPTMALSALVPALMADRHERCFVIGWGTGVTAGELAALEDTREVRVAEISRGVIAAAPLFDEGNLAASKNPKLEILRGDAYRTLLRSDGVFDLIVSEPSNPWVSGVEMLYTREFLEAARSRLAPGGVYGQWFHLYETDLEVVKLVLRTYAQVFPHVSVWFALGPDLLLLGFDRPERALDVAALESRFEREDFRAGFARVGIEAFVPLLAHELLPLGTLHAAELPGPIHTLRHPILSYRAGRAFFAGQQAWLPPLVTPAHARVAAENALLRRYAGPGGTLPEDVIEAAAKETCRLNRGEQCAALFARWSFDRPGSPRLAKALAALRRDPATRGMRIQAPELRRLELLFGGRMRAVNGKASLARAERLSQSFLRNYHHAVPFDRRVVEAAWRRCDDERCEARRREAWERMGALDGAPPAPESLGRARRGAAQQGEPPETDPDTATWEDES